VELREQRTPAKGMRFYYLSASSVLLSAETCFTFCPHWPSEQASQSVLAELLRTNGEAAAKHKKRESDVLLLPPIHTCVHEHVGKKAASQKDLSEGKTQIGSHALKSPVFGSAQFFGISFGRTLSKKSEHIAADRLNQGFPVKSFRYTKGLNFSTKMNLCRIQLAVAALMVASGVGLAQQLPQSTHLQPQQEAGGSAVGGLLSGASLRSSLRLLVKVAKNNFLQLKKIS
jgi:hypothetical protein